MNEVFLCEYESGKWAFYDNNKQDGGGLIEELPDMRVIL